ncbi:MAG: hypothetical protein Q9227_008683 [Pyrenula ochraceoflavens]
MDESPSSPNGRYAFSVSPDLLTPLAWAGVAVAAVVVGSRTYVRFRIIPQQKHIATDLWLYHAFLLLIVNAAITTAMTPHINDISSGGPDQVPSIMTYCRLQFASMIIFWTVLWCIKASLLALFYSFLSTTPLRPIWFGVTAFTFATWIGCVAVAFATSRPLPWHKPSDFGMFHQNDRIIVIGYTTAVDIFTDILIMVLPIHAIWNIQLSRAQKWGLTGIFAVSLITVAFSVVRAIEILSDQSNGPVWCNLWSIVESSIAVIVGCLPTFKALFSTRGSSSRKSYASSRRSSAPLQGGRGWSSYQDDHVEDAIEVQTDKQNAIISDSAVPLSPQSPRNLWSPFPSLRSPTRDSLPAAPSPPSFRTSARGPIVAGTASSPSILSSKNVSFGQATTRPRSPSPSSPPITPPEEYQNVERSETPRPLRRSSDEPIIPEEMRDHSELDVWISRSFIVNKYV